MEKSQLQSPHSLFITQGLIKVCGVLEVISYLEQKIVLKLVDTHLVIIGKKMIIKNINESSQIVEATGEVTAVRYTNDIKANIIGKIFK